MGKKGVASTLFILFIILGVIMAMQVRTTIAQKRERTYTELNFDYLLVQLDEQNKMEERLEKLIDEELKKNERLILDFIEQQNDLTIRDQYADIISVMNKASMLDVQGPGIILKLDDAVARKNYDPERLIIHDSDIKAIVNELKKAGAQALSINGERLIATSEQICAGPTIRINKRKYTVPYIIRAIGDPDSLNNSMRNSERLALMQKDNIRIEIKISGNILIPAFKTGSQGLEAYISRMEVLKSGER